MYIEGLKNTRCKELVDFFNDENVLFGTAILPLVSENVISKKFYEDPNSHTILGIDNNHIIGICHLSWEDYRWRTIGSLFLAVNSKEHNKGIGSKLTEKILSIAFHYLSMHKVEIEVYTDNEHAIHMYKKIGFIHEGTKRKNAMRNGTYVDAHIFSILNQEFHKKL